MAIDIAGRRVTRIAKIWSDALWWVALLLAGVLGMMFLLAPVLLKAGVNEMAVEVAVAEDHVSRTQPLSSPETPLVSEVVLQERDTTHHLQFRTTDWRMFLMVNWVLLLPFAVLLVGIHLFRSLLADVLAADVFTRRNAVRLSRLGWLVIAVAVLAPPLQYWRSWIVLRRLELTDVVLSPARPDWIASSAIFGLLLLALASVWRYGVELQHDRDLTV